MGAVTPSRSRAGRKLREIRSWIDSVHTPLDWPAATLLAACRTRPALARATRAAMGRVWLRPSLLAGHGVGINPCSAAHLTVYQEIFIDRIYDLARVSFEPDAVVDCGAFEGYFSLLARARFPTPSIVAFEPDATNFKGLMANTGRAGLGITAKPVAVSTGDGEAAFAGGGCGGHLTADSRGATRVPVRSLLAVLEELKPQRLLLKLDIEGEESSLLPAVLPVVPRQCAIFFEWHHGDDSFARISALLGSNGFTTALIRRHELEGVVYIDAFTHRS
jgi:FkbM family methyltransferase